MLTNDLKIGDKIRFISNGTEPCSYDVGDEVHGFIVDIRELGDKIIAILEIEDDPRVLIYKELYEVILA